MTNDDKEREIWSEFDERKKNHRAEMNSVETESYRIRATDANL